MLPAFEITSGHLCVADPIFVSTPDRFERPARNGVWRELSVSGPDGGIQRFDYAHVDADLTRLLRPVNTVIVDSGKIAVGDTAHLDDRAEDFTMEGDGEYLIYVSLDDAGQVERVAVDCRPELRFDRDDVIYNRDRRLRSVLREAPTEPELLAHYLVDHGWGQPGTTVANIVNILRTCADDIEARAYNLAERGLTPPIPDHVTVLEFGGFVHLDPPLPIPTPVVGLRPGTWLAHVGKDHQGRVFQVVLEHLQHMENGWPRNEGWVRCEDGFLSITDKDGTRFSASTPAGTGGYPAMSERTEHGVEFLQVIFFLPDDIEEMHPAA